MDVLKYSLCLAILVLECLRQEVVEGSKDESLLLDSILKNYDTRSRPVEYFNNSLYITFGISLLQLLHVDEKHQTITTKIWRHMNWIDYNLKWSPADYGNISQTWITPSEIWSPDIQIYNMAANDKQVKSNAKYIVGNDGSVIQVLPMVVKTTCQMDVTWFPFDEQKCPLKFGSWTIATKHLNLELNKSSPDTSLFIENGEWKLIGLSGVRIYHTYACCPEESYSNIIYTIHLKRKTLYYFFNLLVPCGLIGFLAILGFTLPPESGEKLSLGVTVLFSLIVFLNTIADTKPANSDAVPLLGTYFNCVMFMIALSVVSTIVVNLKLRSLNVKEVEGFSKKLFLYWLPWMLRMSSHLNLIFGQRDRELCFKNKIEDATPSHAHLPDRKQSLNRISTDEIHNRQWAFIAIVIDRLCLMISFIFTLISVTVFLIYAF